MKPSADKDIKKYAETVQKLRENRNLMICRIVSDIKKEFPDCAVTLSIGERSRESYQAYHDAGADRYLLRHETADKQHYDRLDPSTAVFHYVGNIAFDISGISAKVSYENMWRSHLCYCGVCASSLSQLFQPKVAAE